MKKYIKMNNSDEHLSLGNLFRLIKMLSTNKNAALQTDLFCDLFDIDDINDTTVNNYCIGARGIGNIYRQKYANYKKKYTNDKNILIDVVVNIINCMDGSINESTNQLEFINNSDSFKKLVKQLFYISKNDYQVSDDLVNNYNNLINKNNYYECFINMLFFIVLEKKQPLYEENVKKDVIDNILSDSSISSFELEEYLSLKLREGIHYDYSMSALADKGNTYANYELGCNEYYGYFKGYPRYDLAYKYLKKSSDRGHANSSYMIGTMYLKGFIGGMSNEDLKLAYDYFIKALDLGNIAAINSLGMMYYDGIYPLEKDIDKALEYFTKASDYENIFAYNNLGKHYELIGDIDKAYSYYLKAASLKESWACNKMGEYYRSVKCDMKKGYDYYNDAISTNYQITCYYAYYNLAIYYYKNGCLDIVLNKDIDKYLEYLNIASCNDIIEASIELLDYYTNLYVKSKDKKIFDIIKELIIKIENNDKYNDEIYCIVKDKMSLIEKNNNISLISLFSID